MSSFQAASLSDFMIMRTRPISPSRLGIFAQCPLRYALETEKAAVASIPRGLMALRGSAVHRVIEEFSERPQPTPKELRQAFCAALTQTIVRLKGSPLIHLAFNQHGTSALFTAEQQVSACQFIRKVLARQLPREAAGMRPRAVPAKPNRPFSFGRERKLASAKLDMEGWVDLVYKDNAGIVHVCDFKTGNVLDVDEEPKHAYLLQISAYGLLAKDLLGLDEIALELVGPTSGWTTMLSIRLETMVRQTTRALQTCLPKLVPVQGESLAAPGSWCESCTVRPSCPVYLRALRSGSTAENLTCRFDIAGTVTDVLSAGEFWRIRILRQNGKHVSLSGVPASVYPDLAQGKRILGFSLGSYDVLARAASPANFYIFRPDDPKASAFNSRLEIDSC